MSKKKVSQHHPPRDSSASWSNAGLNVAWMQAECSGGYGEGFFADWHVADCATAECRCGGPPLAPQPLPHASGWVLLAPRGGPTTSSANTPLFDDVAVPPLTWSSTWAEGPFHLNVIGLPDLGLLVEFRRLHVRSWIHGHVSVSRREGGFWNGIKWISIKWFNGFNNQYQQWVCHRIYLTGIKIVKKVEEKQETVKQANSVKKSGLKFVQSFQS